MSNHTKINLEKFADGALAEKVDRELQRVIENIYDPNTNPTKDRKITITLTLSADEKREYIDTGIDVKASLVGYKPASAKMIMGKQDGQVTARELVSGKKDQMFFDAADGVVKTDIGEPVSEVEEKNKPVAFKGAN
ncbi:MAG: hypothetical protein RR595_05645 [Lysinibacillus sp.]